MLETFRGIVLRTVKYGDTSLVVDLYTREYGRKSFTTSSARIKRSVCGVSFWQPMSMLEMTADIRQASSRLPRLADVRSYRCYSDLPYSPVKSTLALFLAEFLCAALKDEREDGALYQYVESSLLWLDAVRQPMAIANFHLVFIMRLTRFVGIYPNMEGEGEYFDLVSGCYSRVRPIHSHFLVADEAKALPLLYYSLVTSQFRGQLLSLFCVAPSFTRSQLSFQLLRFQQNGIDVKDSRACDRRERAHPLSDRHN